MLYSLVAAVITLSLFIAIFVPYLAIKCFEKGYRVKNGEKLTMIEQKPFVSLKKKREMSKENEKYSKILNNIDKYQGNSIGQEEIR